MAEGKAKMTAKRAEETLNFCRHLAGSCRLVAVCARGDYAPVPPATATVLQVLVILHDFRPRLMNYVKVIDHTNVLVLAVDEWVFERDVDRGFLGEALASALMFPYSVMFNEDYLHLQEVKLKRRMCVELLQSLILDFPELSSELSMKPEYFMYEALWTRSKLFPPTLYALANLAGSEKGRDGLRRCLRGFREALKQLEEEGVIYHSNNCVNGYLKIAGRFVNKCKRPKVRFTDLFKTGQRTLFASLLGIFPQVLNTFTQDHELLFRFQRIFDEAKTLRLIEDPENYVYVPTSRGLVPLANRVNFEAFARKVLSMPRNAKVEVKNIGGILNDVYLIGTSSGGMHKKVIVKRFRDWSNFKWFPLTLWSVGTRTFAVAGNSRLERECAINRLLDSQGFAVPRLLHVSPSNRLIVMDFVEGEDISEVVKRATSSKNTLETTKALDVVAMVGTTLARVHALRIALGDTKPENIKVDKQGTIYLMDFEQAGRNGDATWDIAEFLYYSGHDISPLAEVNRIEQFGQTFVDAYLKAGGNINTVKQAGNPKYTKVFSVFTFPHIMFILSNICRRADRMKV